MRKTGRPSKPTALHKLHGTARADRNSRPDEPQPVGELRDPPDWLNESQRAGWQYAIEHSPPGLLKMLDRGALALWVEAEDRHRIASMTQSLLNKNSTAPFLIKGPDGMMMSPYVDIIDRAAKIMFRAIQELGFSPASRPRIHVAPAASNEPKNPWAALRLIPGGKAS